MDTHYACSEENRRQMVALSALNGIDYIEVVDHDFAAPPFDFDNLRQRTLLVYFVQPVAGLGTGNVRIEGGVRIRKIDVLWAHPALAIPSGLLRPGEAVYYQGLFKASHVLVVRTDVHGDFSRYQLRLVTGPTDDRPPGAFDRQLCSAGFSFKAECPSEFDCKPVQACPPKHFESPEIDILAKDYDSFRRLMLDRMSLLMPAWRERNPADVQIALAEVLAYTADRLSYYQDAVATEAYLGTARRRASLRRHVRLLDYRPHEGANARAWIVFAVSKPVVLDVSQGPIRVLSRGSGGPAIAPGSPQEADALREDPLIFELMHSASLHPSRNEIHFYTWGDANCCLPSGSTRATLADQDPPCGLQAGDVLIFEEVRGLTAAGDVEAPPDPAHRHAVRLTGVTPAVDKVNGDKQVLDVEWHAEDALPFPLCLSAVVRKGSDEERVADMSVARGNVVLADHGATVAGEPLIPETVPASGRYRPHLQRGPLVFAGPAYDPADPGSSAAAALGVDPRAAMPAVSLNLGAERWDAQPDLLNSDRFETSFVVEMGEDRLAQLRFGDDLFGRKPGAGSQFSATYRVGGGLAGNAGADALTRIMFNSNDILAVRNPLPADGGVEPEPFERVRSQAPHAFRVQERAVTEADYARIVERHAGVQKAAATMRWTGSWYTSFVTVDRKGGREIDAGFEADVRKHVDSYRMAGVDVEVDGPIFAPLDIELAICVRPGHFRSDVKQALLAAFGNRLLPGGRRGFFHPDSFTFGQALYLSQLVEAALAVPGVASVIVSRFQRWGRQPDGELASGVITPAYLEILRLDNDPSFPENGRIEFVMSGGL